MRDRKLAFFGQVGNTASSLLVICAKLGIDFVQVGPQADVPGNRTYRPELWEACQKLAAMSGATLSVTDDIDEGVRGVDAVYTDVWVGMGQPADLWRDRIALLEPYRVTEAVMAKANPDAIFMHCLPSFRDTNTTIGAEIAEQFGVTEMEVEDVVFESDASRVFQEAENRMHHQGRHVRYAEVAVFRRRTFLRCGGLNHAAPFSVTPPVDPLAVGGRSRPI